MKKIFLALLLVGCSVNVNAGILDLSEKQVFNRTTFEVDNYTKVRRYISPLEVFKGPGYFDSTNVEGYFKLEKNETTENICLFLNIRGENWSFIQSAYDSQGNTLILKEADKRVGTVLGKSGVIETICIVMTKEYIVNHMDQGLDMKLIGQRNSVIVKIRPQTLKGFFGAVEKIEEIKFSNIVKQDDIKAP